MTSFVVFHLCTFSVVINGQIAGGMQPSLHNPLLLFTLTPFTDAVLDSYKIMRPNSFISIARVGSHHGRDMWNGNSVSLCNLCAMQSTLSRCCEKMRARSKSTATIIFLVLHVMEGVRLAIPKVINNLVNTMTKNSSYDDKCMQKPMTHTYRTGAKKGSVSCQ